MVTSKLNEDLLEFYSSVFTRLQSIVASHKGLSKPQLICVPTEYCVQKTRVMVVGQQTYGWDDTIFSDGSYSPKQLMNLYANFTQSRQSKGSPFWQAGSKLQTIVNTGQPSHSFLWSNLVKLDQSNGRPDADAENDICRLGILQKEIDITRPDAVVFFTGPKYDERLKETFPGLKCTPEVGLLIRIKHPCLPKLCYRTYHPKYLRFSRNWKVIQEIAEEIKHARQLTNG